MKLATFYGITELEAQKTAEVLMTVYQMSYTQALRTMTELEGRAIMTSKSFQYLNVQRLILYMRAIRAIEVLPYITPPETLPPIGKAMLPSFDEELLFRKHLLPLRVLEKERMLRRERLHTEEKLEKLRLLKLHQRSITCIEQRPLASLESQLYTFNLQWYEQILLKIIDMCKTKQLYLERIIGQEALQKLMLQLYVPMYMEMPMTINAIAFRLTQATMQYASGMAGTIYSAITSVGQAIKTKMHLIPTQKRRLETKALSSGKKRKERFQTKSSSDYEEHIHGKTKIKVGKGLTGKEVAVLTLAMAYGMPYWLKRQLIQQFGLPENSKLYRKPYVFFIPVRRTLRKSYRGRRFQRSITPFNRDEYLKLIQKYGSRH